MVDPGLDLVTIAQAFPAFAYQQVEALGVLISEDDVLRVVDAVLLPALRQPTPS